MGIVKAYYPPEMLELQKELKNHPDIIKDIEEAGCQQLGETLGVIGARLNIVLHGMYDPVDLMRMLLEKLRERATLVVKVDPRFLDVFTKDEKSSESDS